MNSLLLLMLFLYLSIGIRCLDHKNDKTKCKVRNSRTRMPKSLIVGGGGVPIKTATATGGLTTATQVCLPARVCLRWRRRTSDGRTTRCVRSVYVRCINAQNVDNIPQGCSPAVMHGLIEQGSLGDVAFCLTFDPDSLNRLHYGFTPLMISSMLRRTRMVRLLLSRGAGVNAKHDGLDGVTALHLAASAGAIGAAKELLEKGRMPVDTEDNFNRTPLWHASSNNQPSMIRMLFSNFGAKLESRDSGHLYEEINGATPLYAAAQFGAADAAVELLRIGAQVDGLRGDGSAPVVAAIVAGHVDVVQILIQHGASNFIVDKSGFDVFEWVMSRDDVGILKLLLSSGPGKQHFKNNFKKLLFASEVNKSDKILIYLLEIDIFGSRKQLEEDEVSEPKHESSGTYEEYPIRIFRLSMNRGNNEDQILAFNNEVSPLEYAICCGHWDIIKKWQADNETQKEEIKRSTKRTQQCGNETIYSILLD